MNVSICVCIYIYIYTGTHTLSCIVSLLCSVVYDLLICVVSDVQTSRRELGGRGHRADLRSSGFDSSRGRCLHSGGFRTSNIMYHNLV